MRLDTKSYNEINEALIDAFDSKSLAMMTRAHLGKKLDNIINTNTGFAEQVHELIEWAQQKDRVGELVTGAKSSVPTNRKVQALSDDYDSMLLNSSEAEESKDLLPVPQWLLVLSGVIALAVVSIIVIFKQTDNPLHVEYMKKYSGNTLYALLPPNVLPNQLERDKLEDMSLPMFNEVSFSVKNDSDEDIILNNELPVQLIDYQPYPDNVDIVVIGGGGGGAYRNFVVDIPTDTREGIVYAVFDEIPGTGETIQDNRTEEVVDFFTLKPGEIEVFNLEVRFDGHGSYTFQPGIEFYQNGDAIQIWTSESISALVPQNITVWDLPSSPDENKYIYRDTCFYAYPRDSGNNFDQVYECNN